MDSNLNRIQISLGDVSLEAPETPDYLNIAAQIIKMRQEQFGGASGSNPRSNTSQTISESNIAGSVANIQEANTQYPYQTQPDKQESVVIQEVNYSLVTDSNESNPISKSSPTAKRGRWFQTQFPLVTIDDGNKIALKSLEELRNILITNGLQPHPRGDASMLLWQVRNRLGFHVEAISGSD